MFAQGSLHRPPFLFEPEHARSDWLLRYRGTTDFSLYHPGDSELRPRADFKRCLGVWGVAWLDSSVALKARASVSEMKPSSRLYDVRMTYAASQTV